MRHKKLGDDSGFIGIERSEGGSFVIAMCKKCTML